MILTPSEMRRLEARLFDAGVSAESLMDDAGRQIAAVVEQFFQKAGCVVAYVGKGNNGGDALVALRHLRERGWDVCVRLAYEKENLGELPKKKLGEAGASDQPQIGRPPRYPFVILDGLLGAGAAGPLRDPIRPMACEINQLRHDQNAYVFAVDLPTGLDGETGEADEDCVRADFACTVGYAKTGLVKDRATNYVGRIAVLPFGGFQTQSVSAEDSDDVATARDLSSLLPPRDFDTHKTQFGRVGIIAGSVGLTGAAVMTSAAAVRGGAGLVTLYVKPEAYAAIAGAAMPEVMVQPGENYEEVLDKKFDVLAIGPGLGTKSADEILRVIDCCKAPMVLDADALNILGTDVSRLRKNPAPRLLTPHPGEMARLFSTRGRSRREIAVSFTKEFPVTLLFKGARTIVAGQGRPLSYNTTGNPGMASGGMGDILTGLCAALIGQGLQPYDAARVGAWLCGRASELAIFNGTQSPQSLTAMASVDMFGRAFEELRSSCF